MMTRLPLPALLSAAVAAAALTGCSLADEQAAQTDGAQCNDDAGLNLPPGFCATVFAEGVGPGRHMAMSQDGTLYVNTLSSAVISNKPDPKRGYLAALRDEDGDGKAERIERFGPTPEQGGIGGTGVAIWKDGLFVEQDDRIVRYQLTPGQMVPTGEPTIIVSGLQLSGDHGMKAIAIDKDGNLFINSGSASNVCETVNRQPGALGKDPCDELPLRAGIWKYRADKEGQVFSPKERYATGIRNTGGIAFDEGGNVFAVQHGRDQLAQNWPKLYTVEQGAELPAEELLLVREGEDYGWPYCYYDGFQKKRVLAPEYGGDGGKTVGRCADKASPIATYPAHFAPTGLAHYPGGALPEAYEGGLFIAFHGSWNRAPAPQDGYRVVFQPMAGGKPAGEAILFADGFAGPDKAAGRPPHRPTGIIVAKDAIYVSDDAGGRIWKIVYRGPADAALTAATATAAENAAEVPPAAGPATSGAAPPAERLPAGVTAQQVALGERIYRGLERSGTCAGCHGPKGEGATIGPPLTGPDWLWGDGSLASIAKVVKEGVTAPKKYPSGMPALGGAPLSDSDVHAVAAYVWTLSRQK